MFNANINYSIYFSFVGQLHVPLTASYHNQVAGFRTIKFRMSQCVDSSVNRSEKGPMKLIQRVKIAHSFLQSVSNQFHFIISSLLM